MDFRRGNTNQESPFDIADAIELLGLLFSGGEPLFCDDAADANDDGLLDIADPIATLSLLFSSGLPFPSPGSATSGPDPTPDSIYCNVSSCS